MSNIPSNWYNKSRRILVTIDNNTGLSLRRETSEYWDSGRVFGGNVEFIPPNSSGKFAAAERDNSILRGVSGAITFGIYDNSARVGGLALGFSNPCIGSPKLKAIPNASALIAYNSMTAN